MSAARRDRSKGDVMERYLDAQTRYRFALERRPREVLISSLDDCPGGCGQPEEACECWS